MIALAVIAGGISWWRMEDATRQMIVGGMVNILAWLGIVLILPWISFPLIGKVARMESNFAGGVLVGVYTIVETVMLAWLFDWHITNVTAWAFLLVGGLVAGAYNLFTCDWIAEKVS